VDDEYWDMVIEALLEDIAELHTIYLVKKRGD